MNYRHAYHAGNFADAVKHVILARIIVYMQRKNAAFRVIDTHAGRGLYDLSSVEAQKTGEWRAGAGRVFNAPPPADVRELLKPWRDAVASGTDGVPDVYPGSPLIARRLLRRQDRLTAIELHPADAAALRSLFAGDHQVRVIELDGWLALNAHLPPKERRGVVLVDPPFEDRDEFDRMVDGLEKGHRRFPAGVFCLWYPIKNRAAVRHFRARLRATGIGRILDAVVMVRDRPASEAFDGTGMIVVNPPFALEGELRIVLPWLADALAQGEGAGYRIDWIRAEGDSAP